MNLGGLMTMSVRLESIIERMRRIDPDVFPGPVSKDMIRKDMIRKDMIQVTEQQLGGCFPTKLL